MMKVLDVETLKNGDKEVTVVFKPVRIDGKTIETMKIRMPQRVYADLANPKKGDRLLNKYLLLTIRTMPDPLKQISIY